VGIPQPRRAVYELLTCAVALTLGASAASAQDKPSEAPVPSCLDQSIVDELGQTLRPRGVQRRKFLKNKRLELVASGGLFAADLLSSSYAWGGSAIFYFTEDFAVETSFHVSPVALDLDGPVADFFGDEELDDLFEEEGNGYLAFVNMVWSPISAKMKVFDGILHSDIQFFAGAGRVFHDSVQGLSFDAGIAIELFTTDWLTIRLDARDVIMVQEVVSETRVTNNIVATAGLGFWVPFW